MACASWITAVAATTVADMSETTPGSSQHPDISAPPCGDDQGPPRGLRW
jgi:hypothetical protein